MRDKIAGELEPYIDLIGDKRHNNKLLLDCLFSAQVPTCLPPVVQSVARKVDYSYLRPSILNVNLVMSVASGWRKALRMRMGIEGSYGCLLGLCLKLTGSRFYPDTLKSVKNLFPDIFKTMHASYLERNPLIIQRQNN